MERDIMISDKQYLLGLTVFFFPYAIFQVLPSSVCLDLGLINCIAHEQCRSTQTPTFYLAFIYGITVGYCYGGGINPDVNGMMLRYVFRHCTEQSRITKAILVTG